MYTTAIAISQWGCVGVVVGVGSITILQWERKRVCVCVYICIIVRTKKKRPSINTPAILFLHWQREMVCVWVDLWVCMCVWWWGGARWTNMMKDDDAIRWCLRLSPLKLPCSTETEKGRDRERERERERKKERVCVYMYEDICTYMNIKSCYRRPLMRMRAVCDECTCANVWLCV